jgi:hypothetical protein
VDSELRVCDSNILVLGAEQSVMTSHEIPAGTDTEKETWRDALLLQLEDLSIVGRRLFQLPHGMLRNNSVSYVGLGLGRRFRAVSRLVHPDQNQWPPELKVRCTAAFIRLSNEYEELGKGVSVTQPSSAAEDSSDELSDDSDFPPEPPQQRRRTASGSAPARARPSTRASSSRRSAPAPPPRFVDSIILKYKKHMIIIIGSIVSKAAWFLTLVTGLLRRVERELSGLPRRPRLRHRHGMLRLFSFIQCFVGDRGDSQLLRRPRLRRLHGMSRLLSSMQCFVGDRGLSRLLRRPRLRRRHGMSRLLSFMQCFVGDRVVDRELQRHRHVLRLRRLLMLKVFRPLAIRHLKSSTFRSL